MIMGMGNLLACIFGGESERFDGGEQGCVVQYGGRVEGGEECGVRRVYNDGERDRGE
jgi:hypothetical protein